jgi:DNA polymerase I-like protein with 3'-5' exonuclease and polymerase domains
VEPVRITSMKALQERLSEILEELSVDHNHLLAAGANPILALEDLGYSLSRRVLEDLEDRSRFSREETTTRRELRRRIFDLAGTTFHVSDESELDRVLFDVLKIERPRQSRQMIQQPRFERGEEPEEQPSPDPLERLRDVHPVIEPLLEYRRLDATRPQFAPRSRYEEIKSGKRQLPITSIRIRSAGEKAVLAETNANR